jgi:hypothetical protein
MMAKPKKKKTTLPCKFDELDKHIQMNKEEMRQYIIGEIEKAVRDKHETIELFNFDESQYVVILHQSEYLSNLQFFLEYYIGTEEYEKCVKPKELIRLIKLNTEKVKTNYI